MCLPESCLVYICREPNQRCHGHCSIFFFVLFTLLFTESFDNMFMAGSRKYSVCLYQRLTELDGFVLSFDPKPIPDLKSILDSGIIFPFQMELLLKDCQQTRKLLPLIKVKLIGSGYQMWALLPTKHVQSDLALCLVSN
ncbi:uncharacterized protein LOC108203531 isoform X2 [Daucus carota subsp. sativus]|uniref:uncharacterized protein LOC108203531 isoform X2 n=1 Tax=Daucus carota subsp. sativus TaxID=79200 RepID=UPI0030835466